MSKHTIDDTPRILAPPDLPPRHLQQRIAPDDRKRKASLQFPVLLLELLVLVAPTLRKFVHLYVVIPNIVQDILFEARDLRARQTVRLRDHQDNVDFAVQPLHELQVHLAQAVAPGGHEVQAAVDPVVLDVAPVQAALVGEVLTELVVDVIGADLPAVLAVDGVAKTGRVDYC